MSVGRLRRLLMCGALLGSVVSPAHAALFTFNTRLGFDLAAPGLAVETFENALVNPASVTICNGPLSSAVASGCFLSGGLLPGVTYSSSPRSSMAVLGAGFASLPITSRVLGPNAFADTLNLTFTSANAVGLNLFPGPSAGTVLVSVFGAGDLLQGIFNVAAPLGGLFFGVISDAGLIVRLNIASQSATPGELIDNVAFGNRTVPEPASVALLAMASAGLAARRRRRRRS